VAKHTLLILNKKTGLRKKVLVIDIHASHVYHEKARSFMERYSVSQYKYYSFVLLEKPNINVAGRYLRAEEIMSVTNTSA
jgi:hypothetical protein